MTTRTALRHRTVPALLSLGLVLAGLTVSSPASAAAVVELRPGGGLSQDYGAAPADARAALSFDVPTLPVGGPTFLGVTLRAKDAANRYQVVVRLDPSGTTRLDLRQVVAGAERTLASTPLPTVVTPGDQIRVEGHVAGTSPVALAGRAWVEGESRPGWQVGRQHSSGERLTAAGRWGATGYLSVNAVPLKVDLREPQAISTGPEPAIGGSTPAPAPAPAPGSVKPSASNTGVPSGTALRVHNGDMRITTAGAVVDAVDIRGFLRVEAPNVTVKRSIVRGGRATRVDGVVTVTPTATNFVIEDSEVYPSQPSVMLDGIKGANFTARRVEVRGGVDNIKVHGSNVLIEASYLHSQNYYSSDPLQSGGATHNDALQVLGGSNIRVIGNTILGHRDLNAAVQVTQDFAATKMELSRNWIDGGGCSVNVNHKKRADLRGFTMRDNRFGRATQYSSCALIMTRGVHPTMSGNTYSDGTGVSAKYM